LALNGPVCQIKVIEHLAGEIFTNAVLAGVVDLDQPFDCLLALYAVESGELMFFRAKITLKALGRRLWGFFRRLVDSAPKALHPPPNQVCIISLWPLERFTELDCWRDSRLCLQCLKFEVFSQALLQLLNHDALIS
jgi:hypothetical protein